MHSLEFCKGIKVWSCHMASLIVLSIALLMTYLSNFNGQFWSSGWQWPFWNNSFLSVSDKKNEMCHSVLPEMVTVRLEHFWRNQWYNIYCFVRVKTPSQMDVAPWKKHWNKIKLDGIEGYSMVFNGIWWYSLMLFNGIRWYSIRLRRCIGIIASMDRLLTPIVKHC